ncbi:MAG: hypothetical protein HC898_06185 [Phycisphaerales bacterium]|nr:hypothetical protein [Phycisphaerales bacterium]
MLFRVGPYHYRVRVSEKRLCDQNGEDCAGLWEWETRTVWISGTLPLSQRHETLLHELSHAWQRHFGTIASAEDEANRTAAFAIDVQQQLLAQGGNLALMRLGCDGTMTMAPSSRRPVMSVPSAASAPRSSRPVGWSVN